MTGLGGTVRIDKSTTARVGISPTRGIELEISHGETFYSWPIAFDDAEHLAALFTDMARIVRFRAGVGLVEVA